MNFPVYNPHLLGKSEALAQFIARKNLLDRVIEGLRVASPSHLLFIGARGMGKTTLLQRIRYAVEDDLELRSRFMALQFPEEQYAVLGLDTFYLNAMDALSDALEREGLTAQAAELDRAVEQAARSRDGAEPARAALEAAARRLGRKLILLTDNAERVLDELPEKDQWALRETLARSPHLVFFGASTQAIESQFTKDKAFHEFFQIEWVNPLKPAEIEEILVELGRQAGAHGRITRWIEEDRARLQTLIRLTGGNPRTIVILFGLVLQGSGGDVANELERLLDACTPAYKGRIEDLPAQGQAVLHGVAEHFDPISAAEVAARVRMETSTVSTQLTRLLRMGLVEKTDAEESRVRYQIAERFFNIWYLMRQSRRVRSRMRWLVEFLRIFYDRNELLARGREHVARMRESGGPALARHADYALAFSEAMDGPGRASLELGTLRGLLDVEAGRHRIQEIIDLSDVGDPLRNRAERLLALDEARELVFAANVTLKRWSAGKFWHLLGGSPELSAAQKREVATKLETMTEKSMEALLSRLTPLKSLESVGASHEFAALTDLVGRLLRERQVTGLGSNVEDREEWADALRNLPDDWQTDLARRFGAARCKCAIAMAWLMTGVIEPAIEIMDGAIHRWPRSGVVNVMSGFLLHRQGKLKEAERAYRHALALRSSLFCSYNLGLLLHDLGRPGDAIQTFGEIVNSKPKFSRAWFALGNIQASCGRQREAEVTLRRGLFLDPSYPEAWRGLGQILNGEAATDCFIRFAGLKPDEKDGWNRLIPSLPSLEAAARGALSEHPNHPVASTYLAAVTAAQSGWAAAEPLATAALPRLTAPQLQTTWWALETLSRAAVEAREPGLAAILERAGLDEPWRPWVIALRAAQSGRLADLKLVAPETREPATAILQSIAPDLFD